MSGLTPRLTFNLVRKCIISNGRQRPGKDQQKFSEKKQTLHSLVMAVYIIDATHVNWWKRLMTSKSQIVWMIGCRIQQRNSLSTNKAQISMETPVLHQRGDNSSDKEMQTESTLPIPLITIDKGDNRIHRQHQRCLWNRYLDDNLCRAMRQR